ncbi:MAG: ROK family protein, partial [Hungatella hathewayi]|nr:ROK family protein [Hungatella hathewayi]
MQIIAGIDIGGTKSAVSFARYADGGIEILDKVKRPTRTADYHSAFHEYIEIIQTQLKASPDWRLCSIGISCGGPLDAEKGIIMAPPNLPEWDNADIFTPLRNAFRVPVMLQNDADACALAEWRLGAGKGTKNMVFLTFGTGMGAGMILNGQLYQGATCMAG